jgi:hypothetical protein
VQEVQLVGPLLGVTVVPLAGETESQFPPLAVVAAALNVKATGVLPTLIVCAAGALPPCGCVKVRPAEGVGEAEMVPALTASVT